MKIIFFVAIVLPCIFYTMVYGDSDKRELDIQMDKDKTVYIIGGQTDSRQKDQADEDRQNSWEMLKNSHIRIDQRR
ncbi:MAG: hypothetical protein N3D15_03495 [Syntrophorhabdaceae bacterium]|nr:hypothetical protein [Syntrophorhabdaceae bacterium]